MAKQLLRFHPGSAGFPVLDQKAMRVVIGLGFQNPDLPAGNQSAVNRTAGTDQLLSCITDKAIRFIVDVQRNTVHLDTLGDIGSDQVIEITRFPQIIISLLCRIVCQV